MGITLHGAEGWGAVALAVATIVGYEEVEVHLVVNGGYIVVVRRGFTVAVEKEDSGAVGRVREEATGKVYIRSHFQWN